MLELAGAKPEESILIDDVEVNVEQAEKLGFKTILYNNHESTSIELAENGIKLRT